MNETSQNSEQRAGIGRKVWSRVARLVPRYSEKKWKASSIHEGYACEAKAVQRSIRSGSMECPEMSLSDTLEVLEIMDEIRSHWV
jgi:hypothetical protein